jgi:hypothetical protein
MVTSQIAVSCACMKGVDGGRHCAPLEIRSRWDAGEALETWREHKRRRDAGQGA